MGVTGQGASPLVAFVKRLQSGSGVAGHVLWSDAIVVTGAVYWSDLDVAFNSSVEVVHPTLLDDSGCAHGAFHGLWLGMFAGFHLFYYCGHECRLPGMLVSMVMYFVHSRHTLTIQLLATALQYSTRTRKYS